MLGMHLATYVRGHRHREDGLVCMHGYEVRHCSQSASCGAVHSQNTPRGPLKLTAVSFSETEAGLVVASRAFRAPNRIQPAAFLYIACISVAGHARDLERRHIAIGMGARSYFFTRPRRALTRRQELPLHGRSGAFRDRRGICSIYRIGTPDRYRS